MSVSRKSAPPRQHPVFVVGFTIVAAAFVAALFIGELPLGHVAYADERALE